LYANPEAPVTDSQAAEFGRLIAERHSGKPVAHLTGTREFWSLDLKVTPDVLVPRPETELLVERALVRIPESGACDLVDLGCGSGAIVIAIGAERRDCKLTATDASPAALAVARGNADRLCPGRIQFIEGSWYTPLAERTFNVIVCNPPYVSTGQQQLTDPELEHEPRQALYSGADGLDDLRQLIDQAPAYLQTGGYLLLEHGFDQADTIATLLEQAGFRHIQLHQDLAGHPRVTEAQIP
jgi:release factor glutamine methyltransferase